MFDILPCYCAFTVALTRLPWHRARTPCIHHTNDSTHRPPWYKHARTHLLSISALAALVAASALATAILTSWPHLHRPYTPL